LSENTITEGVAGLAVTVPSAVGVPYLAVSVAAISVRLPRSRDKELVDQLRQTAAQLAAVLKGKS